MNMLRSKKNILRLLLPIIIITLTLPMDVMAKRKGARLIVRTDDHTEVTGRLISVDLNEQSLVLKTWSGAGMKIYVKEIDTITRIKRKFSFRPIGKGAAIGFGVGAGTAAVLYSDPSGEALIPFWATVIIMGVAAAFLGAVIGTIDSISRTATHKKYHLKSKTPKQLKKLLKKLKKKSLIR